MSDEAAWRIWSEGQDRCEEGIARGEAVEVVPTSYGQNDFILDFLERSGLWSILTGMQPDGLRRANGKKPETLNGVEVIRELAGIDRIQHCGKVLRDTRLMLRAGFNAEQVLPDGLAEILLITPSRWTLKESSREVRLPVWPTE